MRKSEVIDRRGRPIEAGQTILAIRSNEVLVGVVIEAFADRPTHLFPGHWVDVSLEGRGAEGIPSYVLEVQPAHQRYTSYIPRIAGALVACLFGFLGLWMLRVFMAEPYLSETLWSLRGQLLTVTVADILGGSSACIALSVRLWVYVALGR